MPERTFGGLPVNNTKDLFKDGFRTCMLCHAPPKYGKTRLGGTLDKLTQKLLQKPTLYILCEAGEGGGGASIQDQNVDYVMPSSPKELDNIIAELMTDSMYGGVVLDSATEVEGRIVKPAVLKTQSTQTKGAAPQARRFGVPSRDDYHKMGEQMRTWMNMLVDLTTLTTTVNGKVVPDLERRKHVYVTAHSKTVSDDNGKILAIVPKLAGQTAEGICGIFQTVVSIDRKRELKDGKSVIVDSVLESSDRFPYVIGDRFHLIKNGAPLDFVEIYEKFIEPAFGKEQ